MTSMNEPIPNSTEQRLLKYLSLAERCVRHIGLLCVGVLSISLSASTAHATLRITGDRGGLVRDYIERFRKARVAGEDVVIDGICLSACTLVIGMFPPHKVCATSRAVLGFHIASQRSSDGRWLPSTVLTRYMLGYYPAEVRRWIRRHGGLNTRMIYLRGGELAGLVRTCGTGAPVSTPQIRYRGSGGADRR
jgi:hypothetical protein